MFDDSFYIIFTWAPEYFTWAQAWVCPGIGGYITYGWISNESMKCESALLLTKVHQYAASNTVRWFSHQWNMYLCRHKCRQGKVTLTLLPSTMNWVPSWCYHKWTNYCSTCWQLKPVSILPYYRQWSVICKHSVFHFWSKGKTLTLSRSFISTSKCGNLIYSWVVWTFLEEVISEGVSFSQRFNICPHLTLLFCRRSQGLQCTE